MQKHGRRNYKPDQRLSLFKRDKYKCQLCKKDLKDLPDERIVDHKIPLILGGSNRFNNIWLLCLKCDTTKGAKLISQAILTIKNKKQRHYYFYMMLNINKQY